MYAGRIVFAQLIDHLPLHSFRRCVRRYRGHYKVQSFSCLDQYLCMAFAQLTYRESLRDIEACLRAQNSKLYHMGIRGNVSRATLADANEKRDWHIHADFAQVLIRIARPLYGEDSFGVDLDETVYALDATTIDLCLTLFPWAPFQRSKAAIKLHTLLDLLTTPGCSTNSPPRPAPVSRHGSRLYRLRPPPSPQPLGRLLRRPGARQLPLPQALFPPRR